jgi:hypothetical protein
MALTSGFRIYQGARIGRGIVHKAFTRVSIWFGCAKKVIIVHNCGAIWPCPIPTPTGVEDLDLQTKT